MTLYLCIPAESRAIQVLRCGPSTGARNAQAMCWVRLLPGRRVPAASEPSSTVLAAGAALLVAPSRAIWRAKLRQPRRSQREGAALVCPATAGRPQAEP